MAYYEKYKKKNGKEFWQFKAYLGTDPITGKEVRTTRRGFKTKREAQVTFNALQDQFNRGEYGGRKPADKMTFDDLFHRWFESYKGTVKETTASFRLAEYGRMKSEFGDRLVTSFRPYECQQIADDLANRYAKPEQKLIILTAPFEYAERLELIEASPFRKVKLVKRKKVEKKDNFYSKDELKTFLDYVRENESFDKYALYRLLAFSGMRIGETLALTWNDIDFDKATVSIDKTLSKDRVTNHIIINPPKTPSSIRKIKIDYTTIEALARLKELQQGTSEIVFPNIKGVYRDVNNASDSLKKLYTRMEKHGLILRRLSPHGFRHTHTSLLFQSGVNIKVIQKRLGHANVEMTLNVYTHLTDQFQAESERKFLDFMEGV